MQGNLTNVFIAFLWFIAAFSLCLANSCYSYAQYQCQKELNAMLKAQENPGLGYKYSCGNFTKASLCITKRLHICIKTGGSNDSSIFYTDIVKHYTKDPYNCEQVVYQASSSSLVHMLNRPLLILLVLTCYLTNNMFGQMWHNKESTSLLQNNTCRTTINWIDSSHSLIDVRSNIGLLCYLPPQR